MIEKQERSRCALVVGADSLVGGELLRAYARAGSPAYGSTRRRDRLAENRLYLDLADPRLEAKLPADVEVVVLVAAMANYEVCETDPLAYEVNVHGSIRLARQVWAQGRHLVFISTNTVFGGDRPFCNEDDSLSPGIAYARHKADGEQGLKTVATEIDAADRLTVVRLTKIMTARTPPLPDWLNRLEAGEVIQPFADMTFAPLSLGAVATGIKHIADSGRAGTFHLSGADNVSYFAFARELANRMGLPAERVVGTTSEACGVKLRFNPRFSAIGMQRTRNELGLQPQPMTEVVSAVLEERRGETVSQ